MLKIEKLNYEDVVKNPENYINKNLFVYIKEVGIVDGYIEKVDEEYKEPDDEFDYLFNDCREPDDCYTLDEFDCIYSYEEE